MPTPSLLIVPARFKTGKLYSQIPTSGAGDFTVTRATTATRFGPDGLIASVASGIPRLDYYTSGGVTGCPALLVEPSGTNGILNSTDTTTNWTLGGNLTSGAIDVIGVSGNNITIAVSGSNIGSFAGNLRRLSNNVALASGSTYTISFLLKKTGTHTIGGYLASITGGAAGDLAAGFNVSGSFSSGSFYTSTFTTNRIRRVEQWGTDVYRCSETFTMTASGTLTTLSFAPLGTVTSPANSAAGTTMGFAAPQIELGSVPTSFIPTTTGSVTRNADVISVSGAVSGSIGQTEGTIYLEVEAPNASQQVFAIGTGGTNSIHIYKIASSQYRASINGQSGGGSVDLTDSIARTGFVKLAIAYKSGESALVANGSTPVTSATSLTFGALTSVNFFGTYQAALPFRVRAVALYNTRLTNAELQALTAP